VTDVKANFIRKVYDVVHYPSFLDNLPGFEKEVVEAGKAWVSGLHS